MRIETVQNLKDIAIAMHAFHDVHGYFPPPAIYGKDGKPILSWRVAVLPQLNETDLYKEFHLDEPWDGPHNKTLLAKMPKVYRISGAGDATSTFYQVLVGKSTVFEIRKAANGSAPQGIRMGDIYDGSNTTLLVVEAGASVPWTKPEDLPFPESGKLPSLGGVFKDAIHAAFADATVKCLPRNTPEDILRALVTCNGSESIDDAALAFYDAAAPDGDPDQLRKKNAELRRQIETAQGEITRLQQQLLARWQGESKKTDQESLSEQLKLETVQLRHELQDLKDMAWRLKNRLDNPKGP
jgi:hypothetical protein